ncbi:MAG: hypothetical protein GF310_14055 [candidate division Zixibacteria bacterium]|nr:hypothetical protein [candidate division Zixibacteria bacterium]
MICIKNFLTILVTFFLILSCVLTAQEGEALQADSKNSLISGSRSLQFRISNNLTLTSFEGTMISAKKHFTPNSALRFGLGVSAEVGKEDEGSLETDHTRLTIDLVSQYIFYPAPQATINFYFGTGPIISIERQKHDMEYEDSDVDPGYAYSRRISIGMLATWGLEWFVVDNISFICEYGAGIAYDSGYSENASGHQFNEIDNDTFRFFSQGADFGLSVYF